MPFRDPNIQSAPETGNAPIRKPNDPFGPQNLTGDAPKLTFPFTPLPNSGPPPPQPSSGPLQFPFPPGSIPGPPQGMTLPDQRDAEKYPFPSQSPPEKPPWLKALDFPGEPGIDPDYQWEFAPPTPPVDKDEQLRRDFQEKMRKLQQPEYLTPEQLEGLPKAPRQRYKDNRPERFYVDPKRFITDTGNPNGTNA
tara:strand:- start:174 stop:755 length:582 start_codon:yes stop_codon:yes gene_type:complete